MARDQFAHFVGRDVAPDAHCDQHLFLTRRIELGEDADLLGTEILLHRVLDRLDRSLRTADVDDIGLAAQHPDAAIGTTHGAVTRHEAAGAEEAGRGIGVIEVAIGIDRGEADGQRVILVLDKPDAATPFRLGENTAVILHPDSAAQAATKPVGTGPFTVENWAKGSAVTLARWDGHRDASKVRLRKVTFRFINDPAAQVAALLAGDIDGMPRFGALQALKQFQADKRFTVEIGSTAGKGIMAINNRKPPFNDVRVRRALSHAVDRQAFINGAQEGLGRPIGSHFAPTDLGYLDLTKTYPHDPDKARALLREAGVTTPLNVTLTLPPPQYARKGGEIIAAQLAKVGINARIENVEWAQWLAGPFKGNFDLTIINHVEPLDYATAYADPNYYFGYDSARFRGMVATLAATSDQKEKARLWREIQRQLAEDAVNVFIWNPAQVAVFRRGLRGLWNSSPIFANDMAAVSWAPAGA